MIILACDFIQVSTECMLLTSSHNFEDEYHLFINTYMYKDTDTHTHVCVSKNKHITFIHTYTTHTYITIIHTHTPHSHTHTHTTLAHTYIHHTHTHIHHTRTHTYTTLIHTCILSHSRFTANLHFFYIDIHTIFYTEVVNVDVCNISKPIILAPSICLFCTTCNGSYMCTVQWFLL